MAVALSSLRVSSDLDASGYTRGAAQKVAADQQMIAADKARNASLAQADAALVRTIPGMQAISRALLDGYGAGTQFEGMIGRIGKAVDRGMGLDRANVLLDAAYRKFGLTADAARLAESGFVAIAPAVDNLNKKYATLTEAAESANAAIRASAAQTGINESFGINAAPGRLAQDSADAFLAEFGGLEGIARLKAQEAGDAFAADLNERLVGGVKRSAKSAAESFTSMFDELDRIEKLRAQNVSEGLQQSLRDAFRMDSSATQYQLPDASGRTNVATVSALQDLAKAQDEAAAKAATLRAALNPLDAEFARLGKEMANYKTLLNQGVISQQEFEGAQVLAGKRLTDFEKNLKNGANAGRVMSGELVNLSYQLNDVITGVMLGQSPFMIFGQQGGQIFQIFQNSKASVVEFVTVAASKLMGFFTVGRLVFGGIAAVVLGAAFALKDYAAQQEKVALGLTGAGRASGATITGINATANAGSSTSGLSISEARSLATALATTGKVANDNILPIVQMGKDISIAFGVNAKESAELLAKSFSDPVAGAETLNTRLGFLDASMKQQIQNLVAQNRLWDAQKVLQAGAASSLQDVNAAVGTSTKFWTSLGNIISNIWDKTGEGLARATGVGLHLGLDEQLKNAQARLQELQKIASTRSDAVNYGLGTTKQIEEQRQKVDDLTKAMQRYSQASLEAQQRQFSFAQAAAVRFELPQIDAVEKLTNNQELLVQTMIDIDTSGGPASEVLKKMGMSYEQVAAAVAVASSNLRMFKTDFQAQLDSAKIANDAITAFSPGAKGDIARRQSAEATRGSKMGDTEKAALAEQAYQNALKASTTAISEAARERQLAAVQATQSERTAIDAIGKNVGEQYRLTATLQARQQVEQEAARNRTEVDEAAYARLVKQINKTAELKQLSALVSVNDNIKFDSQTVFLSQEDVQIAQQLRQVYPEVGKAMASVQAQGIRLNSIFRDIATTTSQSLVTGLADIFDGTKTVGQGFTDMGRAIVRALQEALIKMLIVGPIMRSMQGMFGGFGMSSIGETSAVAGASSFMMGGQSFPMLPNANGNAFANDNVARFANGSAFGNGIYNSPTMFRFANGGVPSVGMMGEAGPEAVMPLRRAPNGRLGVTMSAEGMGAGGGAVSNVITFGDININIPEGTDVNDPASLGPVVKDAINQAVDARLTYQMRARGLLNRAA